MESQAIAKMIAKLAEEKKAEEIAILDLRQLLFLTDYFVICHAGNDRLVKSISEHIQVKMKEAGEKPLQVAGEAESKWILIDYGNVVVHVFLEETRRFYDIERLWKDAPRLDWQK